jgi:hypothetical protein
MSYTAFHVVFQDELFQGEAEWSGGFDEDGGAWYNSMCLTLSATNKNLSELDLEAMASAINHAIWEGCKSEWDEEYQGPMCGDFTAEHVREALSQSLQRKQRHEKLCTELAVEVDGRKFAVRIELPDLADRDKPDDPSEAKIWICEEPTPLTKEQIEKLTMSIRASLDDMKDGERFNREVTSDIVRREVPNNVEES